MQRVEDWLGENNLLGIDIFNRKYKHEDESFPEWLDRVSGGNKDVRKLIEEKKFLFGGRILANRGLAKTSRKISLSNCYVTIPPNDSIESIYNCAMQLARTFSYGGGCGVDISGLAPRGAKINNAAKTTTGVVSFMDLYNQTTELIGQEGRRGALMISLSCDHPDIEEFIGVKSDLSKSTSANISVRITDKFMEAVKNKQKHKLYFKRESTGEEITKEVDAYELFKKLAEVNWDYAEPGMLFWDRIKEHNMLYNNKDFEFSGVNPCGEMPLPANGACCLGSINLAEFVINNEFDIGDFNYAVHIAVEALNEVLDEGIPLHPLNAQQETVRDWRQIGLGTFGLADCLIKLKIPYGSPESITFCDMIAKSMATMAIETSSLLAHEHGAYPNCNIEAITNSSFFREHANDSSVTLTKQCGLRNSQLLTCAPTGTISTMLGVSGGIEPIFANYYTRKTKSLHGEDVTYKVYTPIVEEHMKHHNLTDDKELPDYFVTSADIPYISRIDVQAAWQDHIDASISSTINLPNQATVQDVENIYMYAWEKGLKGITVYRSGCKREGILSTDVHTTELESNWFDHIQPITKDELGETYGVNVKHKIACGKLYINVCRDKDDNIVEIFVNTGKGGICQSNINTVSRLISLSLRGGIKVEEVIDQLRGIICPACTAATAKGESLSGLSCADAISKVLHKEHNRKRQSITANYVTPNPKANPRCKECSGNLRFEGGCSTCVECGWSKCY